MSLYDPSYHSCVLLVSAYDTNDDGQNDRWDFEPIPTLSESTNVAWVWRLDSGIYTYFGKMLRLFFKSKRKLLGDLCRCAEWALLFYFQVPVRLGRCRFGRWKALIPKSPGRSFGPRQKANSPMILKQGQNRIAINGLTMKILWYYHGNTRKE